MTTRSIYQIAIYRILHFLRSKVCLAVQSWKPEIRRSYFNYENAEEEEKKGLELVEHFDGVWVTWSPKT